MTESDPMRRDPWKADEAGAAARPPEAIAPAPARPSGGRWASHALRSAVALYAEIARSALQLFRARRAT